MGGHSTNWLEGLELPDLKRRLDIVESLDPEIRAVNSSPYGLLSAVFTGDLTRGLRFAEAVRTGWVNINASSNH